MKKQNEGIALVVLIITIIVVLMIVGIFATILIKNGVFKNDEVEKSKNSVVGKAENNTGGSKNNINKGKLPSTKETTPYMPDDKSKIIDNSNLETGLVVADKNDNEWVWIEVHKTVTKDATTDSEIERALQKYAKDYRSSWKDIWYEGCGLTSSEYNSNKSKMLRSIKENGGFWIGRYEAGIEGSNEKPFLARTEDSPRIEEESSKAVSKPDHIPYNHIYCSEAQNLASKMSPDSTRTSSLLFGIQWDLVCKYLEGKEGLTEADINSDSSEWGNYQNNLLKITSSKAMGTEYDDSIWSEGEWKSITEKPSDKAILLTTGATTSTKKMNIYDLAGNEQEWTLEYTTSNTYPCAMRSGDFYSMGVDYPAYSHCIDSAEGEDVATSFRTTLY